MKKQSLNKGDGTFVAIYTCYRKVCGSIEAAILLRILEQKTNSGELPVSWRQSDIISFSRDTLSRYSIKSATKILLDLGMISIKSGQGKAPEYTLYPEVVNKLISTIRNDENLVENSEVELPNLVENSEVELPNFVENSEVDLPNFVENSEVDLPNFVENSEVPSVTSSKTAKNIVENSEEHRRKQRSFCVENSQQVAEKNSTYEEISESPKNNKNIIRMFGEENTSNGSVITTPFTAVASAPLTSVAYASSLAIEKENIHEDEIETTSAIITTSALPIGLGKKKMSTTDVLTEIFIKYSKVPEKKRDAKCKGSASRLMQNWGDKLKTVVEEIGEDAITAMENFIQDEYWLAKGLPLPAFKSQYRKYISTEEPESDDQSGIQTKSKPAKKFPSSTGSGYQPSQFAYTDHHPIAFFAVHDQSGATLRKREALDILQHVGGDLEAEARVAIGFKIDDSMHAIVEEWHSKALAAYKSIKNREYPVLTSPIKGV